METRVLTGGVVDGVGEALGDDMVEVGVDVGLEGEHVGGGEVLTSGENLPDALVAVGCGPVEGDREWVVVGRDAGVGGGEDSGGRIEGLRELVEGDVAGPLLSRVESVGGDGAEWGRLDEAAAKGDLADGVVADVPLIVGVHEVLGGTAEGGEGGGEGGPVGGGVDAEEGWRDVGRVVDGPAERERALLGGKEAGDDRGGGGAVLGGGDVEDDVLASANVDGLLLMEDGVPGVVGGLVLGGFAGASGVLDVDVLDLGSEVGEAPGDVGVVADDDEGNSGERDSGYVEVGSVGGWRLEVGFVPDAGDSVGEVHVV